MSEGQAPEVSKGFLGKMREDAKTILYGFSLREGIAERDQLRTDLKALESEPQNQPEKKEPNPTKASKGFLYDWYDGLKPMTKGFPRIADITVRQAIGIGGIRLLGGINPIPDIVEGRWGVLVAKGLLAGIAASPFVQIAVGMRQESKFNGKHREGIEEIHIRRYQARRAAEPNSNNGQAK